MIFSRPDMA